LRKLKDGMMADTHVAIRKDMQDYAVIGVVPVAVWYHLKVTYPANI